MLGGGVPKAVCATFRPIKGIFKTKHCSRLGIYQGPYLATHLNAIKKEKHTKYIYVGGYLESPNERGL